MYKKIAITIAIFVHNVLASTHFVAWFVATNMFPIYLLTNFIGPTKSSPHFITCFSGRIVTNLTKFYVANPQVCRHASHDLQNSLTSLNIVVPSTPHPKFFSMWFLLQSVFLLLSHATPSSTFVFLWFTSIVSICCPIPSCT
jgi:hypothetical protein